MKMVIGSRSSKPQIRAYTDVLQFGKHKGKTIEEILKIAPGYIIWLVENDVADVSAEIYNDAEEMEYAEDYGFGKFPSIWDYMGDDNH
jgi:exodeoxyribonuclease X-like protein